MSNLAKRIYQERDLLIKAISNLYGDFKNNFIQVYGKSSTEVRDEINNQLTLMNHSEINIDIYIYISSFENEDKVTVIIRKAVK